MGAESGLAPLLRTETPVEDDRQLLEAARNGDRAAAERWVDRTYRTVFAWTCRLCGNRDLAADLTQETYRRAWQALSTFDARCRTTTWLCRIAYNAFLNHRRRPLRAVALE